MPYGVLGRTNRSFSPVWLRLGNPPDVIELAPLVEAALATESPIDITTSPGLWGGYMRGTDAIVSCVSSGDFGRASDAKNAGDLIDANLIETLSCLGRDYLDFYFLRVGGPVEEFRLAGALESLEMARQEGHVRYLGIACEGHALSTLGIMRLHDAFDVLLAPAESLAELQHLARDRRVGTIELQCEGPSDKPNLPDVMQPAGVKMILVRTATEVAAGIGAIR